MHENNNANIQPHKPVQRRKTLATSIAKAAPLHIMILSLPLWGASLILMLFMPVTGSFAAIMMAICVFYLPFKAKRGSCPNCQQLKTFPFSGFGSTCKKCGSELVLRGQFIHQIEDKKIRYGSGRTST